MNHRMLLVPVLATIPVLASAQGTKLVNCRTLEAAGYFVGPDEVLDNDMVCQKVLAGAAEAKKLQPPKPLPGAVISNTEPTNVVEAAKASKELEKKAEAAREATAEKPAAAPEAETPAPVPSAQPTTPAPASVTPPKPEPAPVAPIPPPAAKPEMAFPPKPPAREVAGSPEPTHEPAPLPSAGEPALALTPGSMASAPAVSAQPEAAEGSIEKANAAPAEAAKPETAASAPIVPATPATAAAQVENTNSAPPEVALEPAPATVVPAPAVTPAPHEAGAAPAAAAPAQEVNGFYDANAGNHVVTVAPAEGVKTSFAPGEPASALAAATPPAAAEAPAPVATAPAMAVPDYSDEERERVVKMGAFVKPQEDEPDPSALAHKTTFFPGDQDGFHEGQRPECSKNITLGSLKGEKLVLGTPGWAEKWIVKNQKRMPQVCFSDTPMQAARNYLIVFYTSPGAANGAELSNTVLTAAQGTPASGVGTFTLSYGSTWHYSYDRTVGITVLTRDEADEPHGQPGQAVYATAYTEEGVPVAEHWPPKAKKQVKADPKKPKQVRAAREVLEQVSSELLGQLVDDVGKL